MIPRRPLLAAALAAPFVARAQSFPNRPIRLIVGFAPGGSNDINGRLMAPKLGALLGQPVVVDNRPGAGGNIATELVVRANPDGHTLLLGTIGALAINPTLYRSLPFDPQVDLTPVAMAYDVTNVLVVPMDRPWRSTADLINAAKAAPGTLSYGSSGVGGAGHLAGALLDRMAGIQTIHVPYRGGGPLMTDLLSGKTDFSFATLPTALPQIQGDKLRALAVPTARRTAVLPNLPTVAETLPGYEVGNWSAILGPKGMPAEIVTALNRALLGVLTDPEIVRTLAGHGVEARHSSPAELARFIADETAKWAPVIRASGATVE